MTTLTIRFGPKYPANLSASLARLEACPGELRRWMLESKLQLNPVKTDFIIFALPHLKSLIEQLQPVLHLEECVIHLRPCICSLGVHFDADVSTLTQVSHFTRSVLWQIRAIGLFRRHLDNAACARTVQTLVISNSNHIPTVCWWACHSMRCRWCRIKQPAWSAQVRNRLPSPRCSNSRPGSQYTAVSSTSSLPWSTAHSAHSMLRSTYGTSSRRQNGDPDSDLPVQANTTPRGQRRRLATAHVLCVLQDCGTPYQ